MEKTGHCTFVKYGLVEKRCLKCGYIIWNDKKKEDKFVVSDMVKAGYPKPKCYSK